MSASGSAAPMFSYAQAAKGLAPSTLTNSAPTSSASSDHGSKDTTAPSESTASVAKARNVSGSEDSPPEAVNALPQTQPSSSNKINDESQISEASQIKNDLPANVEENKPRKPVIHSELSKEPEPSNSTQTNGISGTESNSIGIEGEMPASDDQHDRSKELDDDWEKVSLPSNTTEKELRAAPPPVVNIWQKRKEAQEARSKSAPDHRQVSASTIPKAKIPTSLPRDENKRRSVIKEVTVEKEAAIQRRPNSGTRSNPSDRKERSPPQFSPRSNSRQGEKNGPSFPTPADTESWPTPERSTGDERRRSAIYEKADKSDTKTNNQKKWVQMAFVPTAKFETQLPPAAAARRGGRGGNRGRESSGRAVNSTSNVQNADKADGGVAPNPPVPKQGVDQDRGRKAETSRNTRSNSVPAQSRQNEGSTDRSKVTGSKQKLVVTTTGQVFVPETGSRSSSRQPMSASTSLRKPSDPSHVTVSQSTAVPDAVPRSATQNDRNRGGSRDDYRASIDFSDRSYQSGREWSRGRPESAREKSDSWRDRREPRTERGRGGYRGRGSQLSYSGPTQTYTAPLPQNGFETTKPFSSQDNRSRQISQPFTQAQPMSSNRSNPRSQSIPGSMMQGGFYPPVQAFPQSMSPIQTDPNFGNYPVAQMTSGIMSAMPYSDQLNSYALISMVMTQLEYYFSIDNLCKDLFLRKNMDSQGFVPLNVITSFKRIKALTDGQLSPEQLRNVCQQVRNVEFVTGDDGEDRLRSRENWRDFTLPTEERFPSAQNDGPVVHSTPSQYQHQQFVPGNPINPDLTSHSGPFRDASAVMNGYTEPFTPSMPPTQYPSLNSLDGAVSESVTTSTEHIPTDQARKPSTVSPSSQVQSPSPHESNRMSQIITNGHYRSNSNVDIVENVFPDEKIAELKVVVRDPEMITIDSNAVTDTNFSKLRGGAGSPQQLDHLRTIQFGQTPSVASTEEEQPPFWDKDGEIARVPEGPGVIHEDYLSLREKAREQQQKRHFDGALAVLYPFWSSFLVDNFNLSMYEDFTGFALADAEAGNETGKTHLLQFYENVLSSRMPMLRRLASDIVDISREENHFSSPMFRKLRTAWRNGATNLKTRKRLGDLLTVEEKAELDKSS